MCSLYNLCRTAEFCRALEFCSSHCVLLSVDSFSCSCIILSFERVAFQSDRIAGRMKNNAKMHLHLFTQTSESSRIYTQYRCHFRRVISNVVGYRFCVLKWLSCHLGRGARRRCSDAPILLSGCWHGLRTEGETRRRLSPGSRKAFLFQSAAAA